MHAYIHTFIHTYIHALHVDAAVFMCIDLLSCLCACYQIMCCCLCMLV